MTTLFPTRRSCDLQAVTRVPERQSRTTSPAGALERTAPGLKEHRHANIFHRTRSGSAEGDHRQGDGKWRDRHGRPQSWQCLVSLFRRSGEQQRSEEHTSELQSLMRISYAVFCLKKKNKTHN